MPTVVPSYDEEIDIPVDDDAFEDEQDSDASVSTFSWRRHVSPRNLCTRSLRYVYRFMFQFTDFINVIPYHSEVGIMGSIIDLYANEKHYDMEQNYTSYAVKVSHPRYYTTAYALIAYLEKIASRTLAHRKGTLVVLIIKQLR